VSIKVTGSYAVSVLLDDALGSPCGEKARSNVRAARPFDVRTLRVRWGGERRRSRGAVTERTGI
jgi:hypothetical protein